jgi:hypothetical protein
MVANKLTIDLTDENRETLENIKSEIRWTYGNTINTLISTFCRLPNEVKTEMLGILRSNICELYKKMNVAGDFELKELAELSQAYMKMAMFLNDGKRICIENLDSEPSMKKISLKEGYLVCPEN